MEDGDDRESPSSADGAAETEDGGGADGGEDTRGADGPEDRDDSTDNSVLALADREGWHAEGYAARLHYQGDGDRYSVEFYAPSECVLYWKVRPDGEVAVPVGRRTVPTPLRERVRQDLAAVGVAAGIEKQRL